MDKRYEKLFKKYEYCVENNIFCSECNECPRYLPPIGNCILRNDQCIQILGETNACIFFETPSEITPNQWKSMSLLDAINCELLDINDICMEDILVY